MKYSVCTDAVFMGKGSITETMERVKEAGYQLWGGDAFSRMLSLMAGAWQGTPNSLRASMLSSMALFVKTYEAELNDRAFIRRMAIVSPEEIIWLGRIETDIALRFARIIRDKYNGEGQGLPYRFKR